MVIMSCLGGRFMKSGVVQDLARDTRQQAAAGYSFIGQDVFSPVPDRPAKQGIRFTRKDYFQGPSDTLHVQHPFTALPRRFLLFRS